MKLQHTPGQWKIGKSIGNLNTVICLDENNPPGTAIAFTVFRGDQNEPMVNARLIAAAPEMMDALIELYRGIYGNFEPSMQSEIDAREKLKSIIERTTGMKIEEVLE